jgi:signal transduction histidine kinase
VLDLDKRYCRVSADVFSDVTEIKRAGEALQRLNQELEQRGAERTARLEAVDKGLEAFAHSVSHDLRAPWRAVAGLSRVSLEEREFLISPLAPGRGDRAPVRQTWINLLGNAVNFCRGVAEQVIAVGSYINDVVVWAKGEIGEGATLLFALPALGGGE